MRVKVNETKGTITFNHMEVKLQKLYYKHIEDDVKLNKMIETQLRYTQKKDFEKARQHFCNCLMLMYANGVARVDLENLKKINWITDTYIPTIKTYDDDRVDYETLILRRQEELGMYDI